MRATAVVLALPVLAAAQQFAFLDQVKGQVKDIFSKASVSISSAVASATQSINIPKPAESLAAKVAGLAVERVTLDNHKDILKAGAATASPGIESWLIFVTGGNKTCFGLCAHAEEAWNKSVPLISVSRKSPNLGFLDCESDPVLCHAWSVGPPKLLHLQIPQPRADQSEAPTTYRAIDVNRTSITAPEIAAVILEDKYLQTTPYEGFWHPVDGPLAKTGLNVYLGYAMWAFTLVPSWAFMIVVSFASRTFMGRRMPQGQPAAGRAPAAPRS